MGLWNKYILRNIKGQRVKIWANVIRKFKWNFKDS